MEFPNRTGNAFELGFWLPIIASSFRVAETKQGFGFNRVYIYGTTNSSIAEIAGKAH